MSGEIELGMKLITDLWNQITESQYSDDAKVRELITYLSSIKDRFQELQNDEEVSDFVAEKYLTHLTLIKLLYDSHQISTIASNTDQSMDELVDQMKFLHLQMTERQAHQ